MNLSCIILTKNEEKNIDRALKSVSFCDEVLVIDDFSEDKTLQLAERYGAKIFKRNLNNNFSRQRNFALEKSRGKWVLFIDADEEVTPELAGEIKKIINKKSEFSSYYIKRRDYWWGRQLKYGEIKNVNSRGLIRLMQKKYGKWVHSVHEVFQTSEASGRLNAYLNHYPHQNLTEFLHDINFYSTVKAKELLKKGKHIGILEILTYPFGKFVSNYFIRLGFLDGPAGFAYAFLMSFHSFLVRAKLYQYRKIDKE